MSAVLAEPGCSAAASAAQGLGMLLAAAAAEVGSSVAEQELLVGAGTAGRTVVGQAVVAGQAGRSARV